MSDLGLMILAGQVEELRVALEARDARIAELEADDNLNGLLIDRQDDLLTRVVDAIRGPHPDPLTRWSVHDAPEAVRSGQAEIACRLLATHVELERLRANGERG